MLEDPKCTKRFDVWRDCGVRSTIPCNVARPRKTKVFVSYSRHDEGLVKPLADLLGAAANDAVFCDVTSLKPGDAWEDKIFTAVREAPVFVVCWCCESGRSSFVAKEINAALSEGRKRLVPVLLCSTPLPPNLAGRQWIDLREKVVHDCPQPHVKPEPRDGASIGWPRRAPSATEMPNPAEARYGREQLHNYLSARRSMKRTWVVLFLLGVIPFIFSAVWAIFHLVSAKRHYLAATEIGLVVIFLIAALFVFSSFYRGMFQNPEQEADMIALRAWSYFEGLGDK